MATDITTDAPDAKPARRPLVIEVTGPITVPVVNRTGEQVGTVQIDPTEFAREGKIRRQLMHEVVLMYRANQRAGTHHTLRRGEVAGSTKKLFRQKGTGNARAGTRRTNKRKGGGTAKGPKPRDYEYHLPKKAVRAATRMAILSKFQDQEAVILDELAIPEAKTKHVAGLIKALKLKDTTCLIGTAGLSKEDQQKVHRATRNLPNVEIFPAVEFNAYTVLRQKRLVLTRAALDALRQKKGSEAKA